MYYISNRKNGMSLSRKTARLSDFKGTEGEEYLVRSKAESSLFEGIPIYEYQGGRLRKTAGSSIVNIFNFGQYE